MLTPRMRRSSLECRGCLSHFQRLLAYLLVYFLTCLLAQGTLHGLQIRVQHVPPFTTGSQSAPRKDDMGHGLGVADRYHCCSYYSPGVLSVIAESDFIFNFHRG